MTTMALLDLVDDGGADISEVDDSQTALELLRAAAAAGPNQTWTLFSGAVSERETPSLGVGLSEDGTHGWLSWWDGAHSFTPASTSRTGRWVDYWCAGHHMQVDEGRQLPADTVLTVVQEYLISHQRPTSIVWKRED